MRNRLENALGLAAVTFAVGVLLTLIFPLGFVLFFCALIVILIGLWLIFGC